MSYLSKHRTAFLGALGLGAGWVLASLILDTFFGGSPLPWWFAFIVAGVYAAVVVYRNPEGS